MTARSDWLAESLPPSLTRHEDQGLGPIGFCSSQGHGSGYGYGVLVQSPPPPSGLPEDSTRSPVPGNQSNSVANILRTSALPLAIGSVALLLFSSDEGPVLCPWRRCTGGYCPLCGATRSVGSLTRLDFAESFRRFPALALLALVAVVRFWPAKVSNQFQNRFLVTIGALVTAIWIARLVLGEIPGVSTLTWLW